MRPEHLPINKYGYVSIHASVKDATCRTPFRVIVLCFNPRICKRCDFTELVPPNSSIRFNPRICKRCDRTAAILNTRRFVSIHASVKDATTSRPDNFIALSVSIHASVKDATSGPRRLPYRTASFNPRICKRCDLPISRVVVPRLVSIHASVKDATHVYELLKYET